MNNICKDEFEFILGQVYKTRINGEMNLCQLYKEEFDGFIKALYFADIIDANEYTCFANECFRAYFE